MRKILLSLILISAVTKLSAQTSAGEIYQNLKKLNVLGSVLYIAAHPDDENTLMLSYLSKDQLVRTGYMSLTRGDGGQNLIGPEQGYNIGVIRTQELLGARRIDGAEQFFSRAYDFGFSKTRDETLRFWNKDKVLGDVVWMIRKFQPDVIITRFPPDPRAGHGHHQTSAYLAEEAFALAPDPKAYPDQLKFVKTWQTKRLVWNSFTPGFTNKKPTDEKTPFISIEIGGYNTVLGKSYTEIAAESRSMHKSQAFGSSPVRGTRIDYFLHKTGEPAKVSLFDNIDTSWKRVKGSEKVEALISDAIDRFSIAEPVKSVPALLQINAALNQLDEENIYVKTKKTEIQHLLVQCLGLWFESNPKNYSATAGENVDFQISIVKRSGYPVKLVSLKWTGRERDSTFNMSLEDNDLFSLPVSTILPQNIKTTQPYWLEKPIEKGMFQIDQQQDIGYPENRPKTLSEFKFEINGQEFVYTKPWVYKFNDPAEGEIYRPFEVRPAMTVTLNEPVFIFPSPTPKFVGVTIQAQRDSMKGQLKLDLPIGWKSDPTAYDFAIAEKYQQQYKVFKVTPPALYQEVTIKAVAKVGETVYDKSLKTISFRHIPTQTIFPPAETKLARVDVKTSVKRIGYIAGAGDDVPSALRQIGCEVTMLNEAELAKELSAYEAIVVGVRAYNTESRLINYQSKLMDYVKNGGTLVVQYTIPGDQKVKDIGPYPLQTGRDRIAEEDAELKFLIPGHPLFNFPNKITDKDFQGWIQERGLYFAQTWDKTHYQALLSGNDTDETRKEGILLHARYGKGHYIYTGLSFFRELPAGVTGAYRLFANIISVGKTK
ncbi:hypothetical protein DYBT9275_01472 [Dyadobacter sp. CECT 9275]|uniref:PIG-L family deacetylase n=1 Tax=Dyadobacter helix TaxID=2822344 RepID=A0A916J9V9_9BACT|nr:PIG-L family deacetylase [Dyadobacter sp. CECT 9275]CAG4994811.1 hypothetical protein DYBT9275_01472 [Dyadobacter sp. CECT 9275]